MSLRNATAAIGIAQRATSSTAIIYLAFFALSVATALTWAYRFYTPDNLTLASFALIATTLLTIPMGYILFTI